MFRILKKVVGVALGLAVIQHASAYTIYGPLEAYQTTTLDYGTRYYYGNDIELGGPKNFGQGSRLNVPIITYGYDYTFLNYFGAKGVAAIDSAMNELNRLPAASNVKLSKFITQGNQQINYTAQALSLTDIKSTVMSLMVEHMGLLGETHVWDLAYRDPTPVTCEYGYGVWNRNYDPVTYNPTPYVNGVQVGYTVVDLCPSGVQVADAVEAIVDGTSIAEYSYTAVATRYAQKVGGYYLGLTRDDIGGLAYLYHRNHYAYEGLDSNAVAQPFPNSTWNPVNTSATNGGATNGGFQGVFGGVEKITYVKVAYDSLLGTYFVPRTNRYSIPYVTNSVLKTLQVMRITTRPDIIFAAGDLTVEPFNVTPNNYPNAYVRSYSFLTNGALTAGVSAVINSVITPQEIITFNDGPPVYFNENPSFLDSAQFIIYPEIQWGWFDGTTNAPVIFPNSASIATLEQQIESGGNGVPVGLWNPLSAFGNTNGSSSVASP